jgi:hypothetical protein
MKTFNANVSAFLVFLCVFATLTQGYWLGIWQGAFWGSLGLVVLPLWVIASRRKGK